MKYPEGFEYEIDIEGFTTGKDNNQLKDKELLVYISPTDKEYDNVFITTSENENFKMDFGGRITEWRETKTYFYPNNLIRGASKTFKVQNKYDLSKQLDSHKEPLFKRFKIVSSIIFFAFIITFFLFQKDENFLIINYFLTVGVWGWLLFDYEMLQVDKLYFNSIGLGIAIFLYGLFLNKNYEEHTLLILSVTTVPIFLLIIQRPLRLAFIKIMKREPIVDKPAPSFADFVYTIMLLIFPLIIPLIYFKI